MASNDQFNRLFDEKPRHYLGKASRTETDYSFFDRSALPNVARTREMMERWVKRCPAQKRNDIISRLRREKKRANQNQFMDTFFELFLHEFLGGTEGDVQIEPVANGKSPDFSVSENGLDYVVEATYKDFSRTEGFQDSLNESIVLDWLDTLDAPWFGLWVEMEGHLDPMIPKHKLLRPFEAMLKESDHEKLVALHRSRPFGAGMPSKTVTHGNWKLTGRLIPKPSISRREFVQITDSRDGGGILDDIGLVRATLGEKARQCADAQNSIIAIQVTGGSYRWFEVLFGTETLNVTYRRDTGDPVGTEANRLKDGFWFDQQGSRNEHVIGVAFFDVVRPWNVGRVTASFVPNPYIDNPLPNWARAIDRIEFQGGTAKHIPGLPPAAFIHDYEEFDHPLDGQPKSARFELP